MSHFSLYCYRSDKHKNTVLALLFLSFVHDKKTYYHKTCFLITIMSIAKVGYSDVGNFMMVTDLRCWCQNEYFSEFFHYVGIFNVFN